MINDESNLAFTFQKVNTTRKILPIRFKRVYTCISVSEMQTTKLTDYVCPVN